MADDTLRVTLRLKTIDHLFAEPDLSPFDPYYAPYSFAAGMDYLIGEMQRRPRATRTELTVLLPPDQIAAEPGWKRAHARRSGATRRRGPTPLGRPGTSRGSGGAGPRRCAARFRRCQVPLPLVQPDRVGARVLRDIARRGGGGAIGSRVGGDLVATRPIAARELAARLDERSYRTLQGIDLRILPDPNPPASIPDGSGVEDVRLPLPSSRLLSLESRPASVPKRASRSRVARETPQKTRR